MYKNLYILHKDNCYWTVIGDDSDESKEYRKTAPERYNLGTGWKEIAKLSSISTELVKEWQLRINSIFKPYITVNSMICINMNKDEFVKYAQDIGHSGNIAHFLEIMNAIILKYDHNQKHGYVYLVECANDKYKIGCTSNFIRRWESLKKEEQNQAVAMIDVFESSDMCLEEAKLQCICYKHKANSNKVQHHILEHRNSELYDKCVTVRSLWDYYNRKMR